MIGGFFSEMAIGASWNMFTLFFMTCAVRPHFKLPQPKKLLLVYSVLLILISSSFIHLNGVFEFNIKFNPP